MPGGRRFRCCVGFRQRATTRGLWATRLWAAGLLEIEGAVRVAAGIYAEDRDDRVAMFRLRELAERYGPVPGPNGRRRLLNSGRPGSRRALNCLRHNVPVKTSLAKLRAKPGSRTRYAQWMALICLWARVWAGVPCWRSRVDCARSVLW